MTDSSRDIIEHIFDQKILVQASLSNPKNKETASKINIRPILVKEAFCYQVSETRGSQIFHHNTDPDSCKIMIHNLMNSYKQGIFFTTESDFHFLSNSNEHTKVLKKPPTRSLQLTHNREKQYILGDTSSLLFLRELEVTNLQGKVHPHRMDKFRQINRFLEMVDDVIQQLPKNKKLKIVDFGCGKGYLTFALFHYLKMIKKLDITVRGVDLKKEVIHKCQEIAKKLYGPDLSFELGDIQKFQYDEELDIVLVLHACDTATDYALEKAIQWKAKIILASPCCQHELYHQVNAHSLTALLNYGILKERFAALATDAARAHILEIFGYSTQILEFIETEHTGKNLLIRAVKGNSSKSQVRAFQEYKAMRQLLGITPTLERLVNLDL